MGVAGRNLRMFRSVDLLHQDGTVRELFVIAVVLRCTGRSVRKVHLIPFWIEDCVGSERLVLVSVVFGLRDVARLVDEIESVEGILALRSHLRVGSQSDESN